MFKKRNSLYVQGKSHANMLMKRLVIKVAENRGLYAGLSGLYAALAVIEVMAM